MAGPFAGIAREQCPHSAGLAYKITFQNDRRLRILVSRPRSMPCTTECEETPASTVDFGAPSHNTQIQKQ